MDTLPSETLLSVFAELDHWESLQALVLVNRTTHALYARYKSTITAQVLQNVRYSYRPPHFSVRAVLAPSTLPFSSLLPGNLPVKLRLTATLTTPRPIILVPGHTPFSACTMPAITGWSGTTKPGPCSLCFLTRSDFRTVLQLHEIDARGTRTVLSVPTDRKALRNITPWYEHSENWKFVKPGKQWVSEEIDIPNFKVRRGCRYELGFVERMGEMWWCYGEEEELKRRGMGVEDLSPWIIWQSGKRRRDMRSKEKEDTKAEDYPWGWADGKLRMKFELVESVGFEVLGEDGEGAREEEDLSEEETD